MGETTFFPFIWVSAFLAVCTAYDFYSAKIPNAFILSSLVVSAVVMLTTFSSSVWFTSLQSFVLMFMLGFLLFKFRVLGGGDIKALCIASLFLTPSHIPDFLMYSVLWAGAYAFIFYLIAGQLIHVILNSVTVYNKLTQAHHKIPFTFGILLGWFSLFAVGVISWS